ncbi:sentrin-specific protease 1-like isoform X2 [Myzus persicae]|uniref:sentrin-specific protease 1-like isoform X2 n=1 Tax=Myzus persicae TaxID=13164 RepID=UPI000B936D13|nr:sentrin-specific protease 1-like isoform X2 [Myzus persicae]
MANPDEFYFNVIVEATDDETTSHECNPVSPTDDQLLNQLDVDDQLLNQLDVDDQLLNQLDDDQLLNQLDVDDIYVSMVDDNNTFPFENPSQIVLNQENSNVDNGDNGAQNPEIVDLSEEDGNTIITEDPIVDITGIHMIAMSEEQITRFPTHEVHIYENVINYLREKTLNFVVNRKTARGYELQVKHIMVLLTPNSWLTDTIIQNYMFLLVSYCENAFSFSTDMLASYEQRGYQSVQKFFNSNDLSNVDFVFVPINPGHNHWALCVIEIWKGKIEYYDSLKNIDISKELKVVTDFCNEALIDYVNNSNVDRALPTEWTYETCYSPEQLNNTDCGVFTCMNAKYYIFSQRPEFTQEDIPIFRQTIAYELMNTCLEPFLSTDD